MGEEQLPKPNLCMMQDISCAS